MRQTFFALLATTAIGFSSSALAFLDKEKQAAVGQFTDRIIFIMRDPAIGFATDKTLLLRPFLDLNDPLMQRSIELYEEADHLMVQIEQYSMSIATLSTTGATEADAIDTLVKDLEVFRPIAVRFEADMGDFDQRLQLVAAQKTYISALLAAQPIVSAVGRYGQGLLSDYEDTIAALAQSIHEKLHAEYVGLVKFKDVIDQRRIGFLKAVDTEKPNDPKTEKAAIARLNNLSRIMTVTQPYIKRFWATQEELQSVASNVFFNTAKLRLTLLIWVRAHAQLASGVVDGEAFDVLEYEDLIKEAAKLSKGLAAKGSKEQ